MLKVIGALMVIICTSCFGIAFSNDYKCRLNELKDIKRIMIMLKAEIKFARLPLGQSFLSIGKRIDSKFTPFLFSVSNRLSCLEGESFHKIWCEEIDNKMADFKLKSLDIQQLKRLGESFGYLDNEMQLRSIEIYMEEVEHEIAKMTEQMEANIRVFRCLGIMAGLFVVIMLV